MKKKLIIKGQIGKETNIIRCQHKPLPFKLPFYAVHPFHLQSICGLRRPRISSPHTLRTEKNIFTPYTLALNRRGTPSKTLAFSRAPLRLKTKKSWSCGVSLFVDSRGSLGHWVKKDKRAVVSAVEEGKIGTGVQRKRAISSILSFDEMCFRPAQVGQFPFKIFFGLSWNKQREQLKVGGLHPHWSSASTYPDVYFWQRLSF
ncbi:hypothetical protein Pfo_026847 [Paulownia fortunei]|nr:hypothetical protein Pfo_026847 [Paulownia fortunei]